MSSHDAAHHIGIRPTAEVAILYECEAANVVPTFTALCASDHEEGIANVNHLQYAPCCVLHGTGNEEYILQNTMQRCKL